MSKILISAKGGNSSYINGNTTFYTKSNTQTTGKTNFIDRVGVQVFSFCPVREGNFSILSKGYSNDPIVKVLDDQGNQIYYNDDSGYPITKNIWDFYLNFAVTIGKKYYIHIGSYASKLDSTGWVRWEASHPASNINYSSTSTITYTGGSSNYFSGQLSNTRTTNNVSVGNGKIVIKLLDFFKRTTFFFPTLNDKIQLLHGDFSITDNSIKLSTFNAYAATANKTTEFNKKNFDKDKLKLYISSEKNKINIEISPSITIIEKKINKNNITFNPSDDISLFKIKKITVKDFKSGNKIKYYFKIKKYDKTYFCYFKNGNLEETDTIDIEKGNTSEDFLNLTAKNLSVLNTSSIESIIAALDKDEEATTEVEIASFELTLLRKSLYAPLIKDDVHNKNYFDRVETILGNNEKKIKIIYKE